MGALDRLYIDQPKLAEASYYEQLNSLFSLGMIYTDAFSRGLNNLGACSEEIVSDAMPIQKTWLKENKITVDINSHDISDQIVVEQIIKRWLKDSPCSSRFAELDSTRRSRCLRRHLHTDS